MKAFVRVLAIALVIATLCLTLASCGGIKAGTYYNGDKTVTKTYSEYTFKGSKFALDVYLLGNKVGEESFEGTYKVKDGEITFTWENADGEEKSSHQRARSVPEQSLPPFFRRNFQL